MMTINEIKGLIDRALAARKHAYAPYSKFMVGSALLCADGSIYTGVNVENASYPAGICAERTAFSHAVAEGHKDFTALVVAGGPEVGGNAVLSRYCSPCGVCRQFMSEFCGRDFIVILAKSREEYKMLKLGELPL